MDNLHIHTHIHTHHHHSLISQRPDGAENPSYYTPSNPVAPHQGGRNKKMCPTDQVSLGEELMMMDLRRGGGAAAVEEDNLFYRRWDTNFI